MVKSIFSKQHEVLIEILKQVRIERGFTQSELSEKLNQPQSFISKYESGERRLDLIELRQICNALKVSLIDFLKRFEHQLDKYET